MKVPYLLVDAFTESPGSGNRAAVLLDARGLSEEQMRRVAQELETSETVFLTDWKDNVFSVRFFTPVREVEFAGHAAIALAVTLVLQGRLSEGQDRLYLQTPVDNIPVKIDRLESGAVRATMREPAPRFRDVLTWQLVRELVEALGANERYLHRGLPSGVAFSGLWSVFLPLIAPGLVDELEPDMSRLIELSAVLEVDTVHAYAPVGPRAYYARDFAPGLGIPEDPVTGSANGALAALLARAGVVPRREGSAEIQVLQGHHLGVPGVVHVRVEYAVSGKPYAVYVGGPAVIAHSGWVRIE
ncbi:PhzF family phenazine biosynthesis protein [Oceanithermus sp.]